MPRSDSGIERLEPGRHRDRHDLVARLTDEARQALALAADHDDDRSIDHLRLRDVDRAVGGEAAAHVGWPHWGKLHTLDASYLANRYARFGDFVNVRDELDPSRTFSNPYLDRVLG